MDHYKTEIDQPECEPQKNCSVVYDLDGNVIRSCTRLSMIDARLWRNKISS